MRALFILRELISGMPGTLMVAGVPFFFVGQERGNLIISLIFAGARICAVIGANLQAKLKHIDHWKAGVAAESLNFVTVLGVIASFWMESFNLCAIFLALKGLTIGFQTNLSFDWLKRLSTTESLGPLFIVLRSIAQASYGVAAVVLLFVDKESVVTIAYFDALTSLLGVTLYYFLRRFKVESPVEISRSRPSIKSIIFQSNGVIRIFLVDMSLAVAMAGCNFFLLKYGTRYFGATYGYQIALGVYAASFLSCGLVNSLFKGVFLSKTFFQLGAFIFIVVSFTLASLPTSQEVAILPIVGVVCVLISYPIISLLIDKIWFDYLPERVAADTYAVRTLIVQVTWALGEFVYASIYHDTYIRLFFAAVSALLFMTFVMYERRGYKTIQRKEIDYGNVT